MPSAPQPSTDNIADVTPAFSYSCTLFTQTTSPEILVTPYLFYRLRTLAKTMGGVAPSPTLSSSFFPPSSSNIAKLHGAGTPQFAPSRFPDVHSLRTETRANSSC